jgi:1-pyrroline-5-carboxylate dehydrogenase
MDGTFSIENGLARPPVPVNEPVRGYAPGSPERSSIAEALKRIGSAYEEMPLIIGGRDVRTGKLEKAISPHDHAKTLGQAHLAGPGEIQAAIEAAEKARHDWSRTPWVDRAAIFLKAADLLAGPWRSKLNAATMLGQSKTVHQAEIDSAAELIDFWRFNIEYMLRIYADQPDSLPGCWNRVDYRPLDGFVFAVTPFNFTAIAGNLPTAPALMGNTVVWKPAGTAKLAAHFIMQIFKQAGLPDGVINLVYGRGPEISKIVLEHEGFAGLHFTGSTAVFNQINETVARSLAQYRNYPRIVGETGGKNFIVAHPTADLDALATAIVRGGYEYQGQKCSAASRVFVPKSIWPKLRARLTEDIASIKIGDVADFSNFMGAVIDRNSFESLTSVLDAARADGHTKIIAGGKSDGNTGYFISPTLIETDRIDSRYMCEEFFGPIVSAYVYDDDRYLELLETLDKTGRYGLTGSVFATDRKAISAASNVLRAAAGNFYINDKPTGAVVGQQPFGGARASGTNDKAGSMWNLIRWVSPRTIKETFVPPSDYRYPFLA